MQRRFGLLAIVGAASIGALAASAAPASRALAPPTAVRVVVTTFHYRLSRSSVSRGRVVFTVINRSNATIDFKIDKFATPSLRPGRRYVLHTLLPKPGRYVYFASGQFAELGLTGVLTVR